MLQIKTEKMIERSARDVFDAIKQGRLFMNCGGESGSMQIDFKVGGKYHFTMKNYNVSNFGEFLEIIPNKKVVFNWCQSFGPDQKPDSVVTIELFEDGNKTRLQLLHTGFKTQKDVDNHTGGWESVLNDTIEEIQNGRLRLIRVFPAPVENLFAVCKIQFGGEAVESVLNQKLVLTGLGPVGSQLSLAFQAKEDGNSRLELIHTGLAKVEDQMTQRTKWETLIAQIKLTF
jgi:uncharacterized protein YndB with AHSA1/START domain